MDYQPSRQTEKFCIDTVTVDERTRVHPNQKLWITKEVQQLLKERNTAFRSASQEEDPGLGRSACGPAEEGAAQTQRGSRPTRCGSIVRPEDHLFLQLQQTGFDMLERELSGTRQGLNAHLDRVAMLLRPLRRISSLERIAAAMECGPPNAPLAPVVPLHPPVVPLPPPPTPSSSTLSTRSTSRIATPGPSHIQSRRNAHRMPIRGRNN
ncbi:hypothetical protein JOB18_049530 [Solea senegalensis]|uniref:Uncharacterized protein n=1 Tax=Solea senegalensis TaxID=28829 RepID=A0AAV6PHL2_SOLSE|nr:hypothetical protein JOB18_049530 [Solea senegalensis]